MTPSEFRERATALGKGDGPIAVTVRAAWFEAVSDWCVGGHSKLHHKTSTGDLDLCRVCDDCPEEGFTAKSSPLAHDGTDRHEAMLVGALLWALSEETWEQDNDFEHMVEQWLYGGEFPDIGSADLDAVMTMLESAAAQEVTP